MRQLAVAVAAFALACAHRNQGPAPASGQLHADADAFVQGLLADHEPATYSTINGYAAPRLLSCGASAPTWPAAVLDGSLRGMVPLTFVIGASGQVGRIDGDNPKTPPALLDAARTWLRTCRYAPATFFGRPIAVRWNDVFAFSAPQEPAVEEAAPLDATGPSLPAEVTAPKLIDCDAPGLAAPQMISFVVHADGRVSEIEPASEIAPSPEAMKLLRAWLSTCRFEPARQRGAPIAVRWRIQPWPGGAYDDARFANASAPAPRCPTSSEPPMRARRAAIDGVVLVSYRVGTDGRVDAMMRLNDAPPILYQAVREWLLACPYKPAIDNLGRAIPSKVVTPFHFVYEGRPEPGDSTWADALADFIH